MNEIDHTNTTGAGLDTPTSDVDRTADADDESIRWLQQVLPRAMRALFGRPEMEAQFLLLPVAQFRIIRALMDDAASVGLTMGQLSEMLGVKGNALTQAANRIVKQGLIERFSDPNDRRVVLLRLSGTGREWVAARRAKRHARMTRLWSALTETERQELSEAIQVIEKIGKRASELPSEGDAATTRHFETEKEG